MICRKCGQEIPKYLMGRESFECPECGYRYVKRPSQTNRSKQGRPKQQGRSVRQRRQSLAGQMLLRLPRMIIGIISAIMFIIVMFQSCAANVVNTLDSNATDASAGGGTLLAFALLVAGVTGAIGKDSPKATFVAAVIYLIGALIGFVSLGTYGDLIVWSILALIFAGLFGYCYLKLFLHRRR